MKRFYATMHSGIVAKFYVYFEVLIWFRITGMHMYDMHSMRWNEISVKVVFLCPSVDSNKSINKFMEQKRFRWLCWLWFWLMASHRMCIYISKSMILRSNSFESAWQSCVKIRLSTEIHFEMQTVAVSGLFGCLHLLCYELISYKTAELPKMLPDWLWRLRTHR